MDSNLTSSNKTIGSTPSFLDSPMPLVDNDNVKCVGVRSTAIQNPNSVLPPKPKKSEQKLTVWENFTKSEENDPNDTKSQCKHCKKLFSCYPRSHNTSSMLQHLKNTCKKYSDRFDKSQSKLSFEAKREGQVAVGEESVGTLVIVKYNTIKIRVTISKLWMSCNLGLWKVKSFRSSWT